MARVRSEPSGSGIFLAHSSRDKEFVEKLAHDLRNYRLSVWYDSWTLTVGDSLRERIEAGIARSSYLLLVLSPQSVRSRWVRFEMNTAFHRELEARRVFVLPVMHRKCTVPLSLRDKLWADFTSSYDHGLETILKALIPPRTWKRLIHLPPEGTITTTPELERRLCAIYRNRVPVVRHYYFSFLSLLTLPDALLSHLTQGPTRYSRMLTHKKKRHRLGTERLAAATLQTSDVIEDEWLTRYIKTGDYYGIPVPTHLRRRHIDHLLLQIDQGYQLTIVRRPLVQWFLTYKVGPRRVTYISRQFQTGHVGEPIGYFAHGMADFDRYDELFYATIAAAGSAGSGAADRLRFLRRRYL